MLVLLEIEKKIKKKMYVFPKKLETTLDKLIYTNCKPLCNFLP